MRVPLAVLTLTFVLACTHTDTKVSPPAPVAGAGTPAPTPTPSPAFIEAEPEQQHDARLDQLSVALPDGLSVEIHAEPIELDNTWGVQLELEFVNRGEVGTFDLGDEPLVTLMVSVTHPNGSGFGSAGGCNFSSHLHGSKTRPLAPGERYGWSQRWTDRGAGPGEHLEIGLEPCDVVRPDGQRIDAELAQLHAKVDADGQLASFELRASELR